MTQTALDTNAVFPLSSQQWSTIQALRADLRPEQLHWLSGYFAGAAASFAAAPAALGQTTETLTILYGSQTGNGQKVAERAATAAEALGLSVQLHSMENFRAAKLKQEKWLLLVVSTHGEGDPPDGALQFYNELHSKRLSNLQGLKYAVLALGDSSYREFCKTGRDIDARLASLGAECLVDRVDCDVAYEIPAESWVEQSLTIVNEALREQQPGEAGATAQAGLALVQDITRDITVYHDAASRPFAAPVLDKILLSGEGSQKEVWHLELSLEDSGIVYQPGDALGIVPANDPQQVEALIEALGGDPDVPVTVGQESRPLHEALGRTLEITRLTRPVLQRYAEATGHEALLALFADNAEEQLAAFLDGRDWLDLLTEYDPRSVAVTDIVALMRPLAPRLYSIASSPSAYADEVHLTIAAERWQFAQRRRGGVVSTAIADRVAEGDMLPVYVQTNQHFRLPTDGDTPIVMIGPGTGVAPFRAFVEERQQLGHRGGNWLFFGDQHFRSDFLYQAEWLRWRKQGVLQHIDVAFSRDQQEKIYVQHRMVQRARELYRWIQDGAHIYVCGDTTRMAKDVDAALIEIIAQQGGCDAESAQMCLSEMQQQHRYQRDVY